MAITIKKVSTQKELKNILYVLITSYIRIIPIPYPIVL